MNPAEFVNEFETQIQAQEDIATNKPVIEYNSRNGKYYFHVTLVHRNYIRMRMLFVEFDDDLKIEDVTDAIKQINWSDDQ